MQIQNGPSSAKPPRREDHDELLGCRMAMLGLDLFAVDDAGSGRLEEIMRNCVYCGYREACTADLKRDPNDPVWETYCPNAKALLGLAEASWQTR